MSRVRSDSSELPDVVTTYHTSDRYTEIGDYTCPSDTDVDHPNIQNPGGSYNTMTDEVVENFYARMKKGEIFNNPMSKESVIYQATPGTLYFTYDREVVDSNGDGFHKTTVASGTAANPLGNPQDLMSHPDFPSIDIEHLKSLAITSAYANIELSDAAIIATLGEAKETIASLVSITKRVIKILKAVKRLDLAALSGAYDYRTGRLLAKEISFKELGDRYMEYRYSLRPLFYDARMLLKALNTAQKNFEPMRQTFRGTARDNKSITFSDYAGIQTTYFDVIGSGSIYRDVTVRAGVLTAIESLSKMNIWGFDQPLEAAWELIPFSFVVDWFFNVGKTLASWTPEMGTSNLASWVCVEDTAVCSAEVARIDKVDPDTTLWDSFDFSFTGSLNYTRTMKTREVNPQRPILPSFNMNLDCLKLVDLGFILKGLLSK